MREGYSTHFCKLVILSHNKKWISKMATSRRMKQASKCCTGHFKIPLMCQNFSFQLFFQKKLVIFRPYDCKRLLVMPPIVTPYSHEKTTFCCPCSSFALHYILSSLPEYLEFPLKLVEGECCLYAKLLL